MLFFIIILSICIAKSVQSSCPNKEDFQCDNGVCIKSSFVCNNHSDCPDESDETLDCDNFMCRPPNWYKCSDNYTCLSNSFRCDNTTDCPGGDDEDNCEGFQIHHIPRPCATYEYTCADKMCIPLDLVCNGKMDCLDNSDETSGCKDIELKCKGFLCENKHCLESHTWVCDGRNDCGDNSDELNCFPECTVAHKHFLCNDNHTCIDLPKVCNGVKDCDDGSDEDGFCKTQPCTDLKCPGECQNLPLGPICLCSKGFEYNHTTKICDDVNECNIFGICSQGCINTIGSYQCTCVDKFKLRRDGRTCSTRKESLLLYTTLKTVTGFYIESHHKFAIAKNLSQVIGVSYDENRVYWTDISYRTESIVRAMTDGSKREVLLTSGLASPEDLAIDWLTGNIYFTDSLLMQISVCSNTGYYCTILISSSVLHHPRGIALQPMIGQMYWSDWGREPMIGTAEMDGTNVKPFVTDKIHWPNCITIDWPNDRLYWADAKLKTIESISFDGKDRRTVIGDILKHPYGIAVFDDKIYWSDWETQSIHACNKFTGKDHETVLRDKKIYDIHIYNPALMPKDKYPCSDRVCSHMCLLKNNKSYSCGCPQGKELARDNLNCQESTKKRSLLMGLGNYIVAFQHQTFGRHESGRGDSLEIYISKMEYNSLTGNIFIADNIQRMIYILDLTTKETIELVKKDIGNVSALAFDYLSNTLYWSDSERSTIEVISLNNLHRTIVQHYSGIDMPIGLAIMPETGFMYIALRSFGKTHIDKFSLNGQGPHYHVIEEDLGSTGSFSFAVDSELKTVFWSDMSKNRIEMTDFDGDTRHIYQSGIKNPASLAILDDEIFWTTLKSRKLYWSKKLNQQLTKRITIQKPPYISFPDEIVLIAVTTLKVSSHLCLKINGGCSHICVSKGEFENACMCPLGMVFQNNLNTTCIFSHDCDFRCKSGECLQKHKVCDGKFDCADKSDEKECDKEHDSVQCSYDEFQCADGKKCIAIVLRCDMNYNCADRSDEEGCSVDDHKSKCRKNQFSCPSGLCIDVSALCDGYNDCSDNADESNCNFNSNSNKKPLTCATNMFRCTSGQCISKSWECDRQIDCNDASDEHNKCPVAPCPDKFSKCASGHCIDSKLVCDDHNDCGDNSDEENCDLSITISCDSDDDESNVSTKFQCFSNKTICLDLAAKCNGTAECPRGEDESNCTNCGLHEFQCHNTKCIRNEWKCDGMNDCGDASDEENCSSKFEENQSHYLLKSQECKPGMFDCKDGSCIETMNVCDGNNDCSNGLDESGKCNISCIDHPCEHKCKPTPFGPVCSCRNGYDLASNKKHCNDINECRLFSPCSQKCDNIVGSFRCSCFPGFMLRNDKTTCKSMGIGQYMLYTSFNQIRKLSDNPPAISVMWTLNETKITGMDVNIKKNLLYFTVQYSEEIYEYNLLTKTVKSISNIGTPGKVTIDWISNNIYFVDNYGTEPMIKVCHMEGKQCARLIMLKHKDILTAITVDPINRALFYSIMHSWVFQRPETTIYKCLLDGTNLQILVKNVIHITAITIDLNKRLLYFIDMNTRSLYSIKYDGTEQKIVIKSDAAISQPIAMNFFEDHAYIISLGSSTVANCKLYGEKRCNSFDLNVFNAEEMVIVQESRQKIIPDVCAGNNCTIICVQAEKGPKCLCHGGEFIKSGEHCTEMEENMQPKRSLDPKIIHDNSSGSNALKIVIIIFWTLLVLGLLGFIYYKRRVRHGRFNISMHFQNPTLSTDDAEVKMFSAPRIFSSNNRNELCLETDDKTNNSVSYSDTSTAVYSYSDNTADDNSDFNDNPKSRLIV